MEMMEDGKSGKDKKTVEMNKPFPLKEKPAKNITTITSDARFKDVEIFIDNYNLETQIDNFLDNFEASCDFLEVTEKKKLFLLTKLVSETAQTYIKTNPIP
ncbi:hypothetical protein TNCT_433791 [Trichonephila clavata]|uniref:Uncharacterized protein n=1 Tax=Trichonephila clavata TaxID=2740835 RepID=A0A8X6FC65_TRICU|nr:hypothetical protein TNCT_433791 [Trichonephila clavata]